MNRVVEFKRKILNNLKVTITTIVFVLIITATFSQSKEWKTEKTKDGKVVVKSNIAERTDENGKVVQLIEFSAVSSDSLSLQSCIQLMKDISKHKVFWGAESSHTVKEISNNEWIVYYYFDSPWPAPNYDYVAKMNYAFDAATATARFTLSSVPSAYEKKDVKRMTYYNVSYIFKDIGNGLVELTTTSSASPVFKAPAWLVSSYFPNGPAGILRRLAKLAKSK